MNYYIKYHEINVYYSQMEEWADSIREILKELHAQFQELAVEERIEGNTVNAIQNYIDQFHLRVVRGIMVLLEHLQSSIKLYKDDYYSNIDAYEEARLSENAFIECIENMQLQKYQLEEIQDEAKEILNTIYFADIKKPIAESAKYTNEMIIHKVQELAESVAIMEEKHLCDMECDTELIGVLNRFINGCRWQSANNSIEAHVECLDSKDAGQVVDMLTLRVEQKVEEMQDQVDVAEINEGVRRWEKKSQEEGIYFDADLYRNSGIYRATANYIYQIEGMSGNWEGTLSEIKAVYERQKERYEVIATETGIPPEVIAAIHYEENAPDYFAETFGVYLHNGDSLGTTSNKVPYPKYYNIGEFDQAAIDILQSGYMEEKAQILKLTVNSKDIIAMVAFTVVYNGWYDNGKSSYAYNGTDIYLEGVYTSDHHYDSNAKSVNCGTYLIISYLMA